jgi:hypothetical protein
MNRSPSLFLSLTASPIDLGVSRRRESVDYNHLRCKLKQYLFPARMGHSASGHPAPAKQAYWFMESRKS